MAEGSGLLFSDVPFRAPPPSASLARERHPIIVAIVPRDPDLAEEEARVHPKVATIVLRNPARSDTGQCGSRPLEAGQTNGISGSERARQIGDRDVYPDSGCMFLPRDGADL